MKLLKKLTIAGFVWLLSGCSSISSKFSGTSSVDTKEDVVFIFKLKDQNATLDMVVLEKVNRKENGELTRSIGLSGFPDMSEIKTTLDYVVLKPQSLLPQDEAYAISIAQFKRADGLVYTPDEFSRCSSKKLFNFSQQTPGIYYLGEIEVIREEGTSFYRINRDRDELTKFVAKHYPNLAASEIQDAEFQYTELADQCGGSRTIYITI